MKDQNGKKITQKEFAEKDIRVESPEELDKIMVRDLKRAYNLGRKHEKKDWLDSKRCVHCGKPRRENQLTVLCDKCWEEN